MLAETMFFADEVKDAPKEVKYLQDEDYVVCGYIQKEKGVTSIVLGQYRDSELIYKGHVTLGVSGNTFRRILKIPRIPSPLFQAPSGNENAVWIEPKLACTVKYMMKTVNGGMRQPVFKGLCEDKTPEDCIKSK